MDFKRNGIVVSVSDQVVEQLVLERLRGEEARPQIVMARAGVFPRIGAEVAELGGVFAGVARGSASDNDYYLIVGPEAPSKLEWQPANEWADTVEHLGFSDFTLFNRREQAICYGNVPELFQKEAYWSNEQLASGSGYAWYQDFDDGDQYYAARATSAGRERSAEFRFINSVIQ